MTKIRPTSSHIEFSPASMARASLLNVRGILRLILSGAIFVTVGAIQPAWADVITDNFTGASAANNWIALDYACLTAGNSSGTIPACSSPQDAAGSGALRLTPALNNQTGAILSNFTFPSNGGLQVTFTTYTYGGDSGGTAKDGADGISFFLTDGTQTAPTTAGALGGSLGYSCSNVNSKYDGMAYGYLGLGIDEYGNYLNSGDNTNTGVINSNCPGGTTANGTNSWYSCTNQYYQPNRIGMRGAGNVNYAWLNSQDPTDYPSTASSSTKASLVHTACKKGQLKNGTTIAYNYNVIPGAYAVLPNSTLIANESTTTRDKAIPIAYKLLLSSSGYLSLMYSYNNGAYQPVITNQSISASNGPVPTKFRFGFSAGTGGSNNVHEITCFQASPLQSNTSVGANTIQSGELKTGTQIYLSFYNSNNWYGSVTANPLVVNGSGAISASSTANWDADCVLTGGACPSMGVNANGNATNTITVESPSSRQLLTWDGSQGIPFEWTSGITTAQQTVLNSTDSNGQNRLGWLRGVRTNEQLQSPPGTLRARTGVVGDIVDSSPTWVGPPQPNVYPDTFIDYLFPGSTPPESSYSTYVSNNETRTNVVYTGSNDGWLHGFRAGNFKTDGTYDSSNNDGKELIGFMPAGVLANSNIVSLTNPTYGHNYYVDATPGAYDLFYGSSWHTWLVGGVGMGGQEIYALDITDPSTSNFSETNAKKLVMGDWDQSTLSNLGNTVGTPIIARLHNGQWALIFGNGLNSGKSAGIYIGLIDKTSGAISSFTYLDTGVGSTTSPNGIAYVTSADLDGDGITDYLYAGDQQGNVWRFDVTSSNASDWAVSKFGHSTATPLFQATDGATTPSPQPITTAIAVAAATTTDSNNNSEQRVMLLFGTGQKTPQTATSPDKYATGTQTFYGIWDWDMKKWDYGTKTASNTVIPAASSQYAYLTGTQSIARSAGLLSQSVTSTTTSSNNSQILGYRNGSASQNVCWADTSACSSTPQYGWYFDLPGTQEQVIYNPIVVGDAVVVNTAIPPVISASSCNPGTQTGWTMAFGITTGGGLASGFFQNASGSYSPDSTGATVIGVQTNGVGSPFIVDYAGQSYLVTQTVSGTAAVTPPLGANNTGTTSRISWREIIDQ